MKIKKKIKGCACYGVNTIHNCFCSPYINNNKKKSNYEINQKHKNTKR